MTPKSVKSPQKTPRIRVFISHSSEDSDIADEFRVLLGMCIPQLPVDVVRYTGRPATGLKTGDYITPTLVSEIARCDCFLMVVSESWCQSLFCAAEFGAALASRKQLAVGYLTDITPGEAGGTLSGMHMLPLNKMDSVQELLKEIAEAARCTPDPDKKRIEAFCTKVNEHPRKRVDQWRRRLVVPVEEDYVFLNGYGLEPEPRRRDRGLFQDFHLAGRNDQPVQFMWADCRKDESERNSIDAELIKESDSEECRLRIEFNRLAGSDGCNISIRPQDRTALLLGKAASSMSMHIEARLPPDDPKISDVGIRVRLVNGYMQHWRSTSRDLMHVESRSFQGIPHKLGGSWELIEWDGAGRGGPDSADFSIISSVNLDCGLWRDGAMEPKHGHGIVEIREIRFA